MSFAQMPPSARHFFDVEPKGGFYEEKVVVRIEAPDSVKVFYTTNGQMPSARQKSYSNPFRLSNTTVVRVLAVFPDKTRRYRAYTYFIKEPSSTIPVLSLALPPNILFDPNKGIYVEGANSTGEKDFGDGSNYWTKKEVPVHFEFFETDSTEVFNGLVGLRIFGGISRTFPQKSFALVARKKYGKKWIKHRVFGKKGLPKFKYLVLRNSGSDWGCSHLRDGFMTTLVEDWHITKQDYRPAHLYLNGKYWGIYNIREKVNRTFLAQHFDVDKNDLDLLEHRMSLKKGSTKGYKRFINYIKSHDLSKDKYYHSVEKMMDIDNFMDLHIAQIYFNNTDAGGNIKFWRPHLAEAKWKWVLYDTDWGFGLVNRKDYRNNALKDFTEKSDKEWPHPEWSTLILRKLLENKKFERKFINRFLDRLNTDLQPVKVKKLLGQMAKVIHPEMPRQFDRWHLSKRKWKSELSKMKYFAERRPHYLMKHLKRKFNVNDLVEVNIYASKGGKVILNEELKIKDEFTGMYFAEVPISIKAVSKNGFRFVGWEGLETKKKTISISPSALAHVEAKFEPYVHPLAEKIVINEISANNFKSGDWIELLNTSKGSINLKGLILRDKKHEFILPDVTVEGEGFIVICEDTMTFRKVHPDVMNLVGSIGFGFNKHKETISLYSADYAVIDEVKYQVPPADDFQTMALLSPNLDNNQMENWEILDGNGTPEAMNPYYVLSKIQTIRTFYTKLALMVGVVLILGLALYVKHGGQLPLWLTSLLSRVKGKIRSALQ